MNDGNECKFFKNRCNENSENRNNPYPLYYLRILKKSPVKESHPPSLHCPLTLNSRSSFAIFMAPENPSFIILICAHNFPCTFLLLKKWNPSASFHYIFHLTRVFCFTLKGACLHGGEGPQIGEITCGGSPNLSCTRDQIKMRDYMDRRVTPPKQVTSPTLGPSLPCKQALNFTLRKWNGYLQSPRRTDGVTLAVTVLQIYQTVKTVNITKLHVYVTFISLH